MKKKRSEGKNDYGENSGIWYGLFLAQKINFCLLIKKIGTIDEHKTFKGFTNVSDNLDRKECFNMADGGKITASVPLRWKKSFSQGVVIPHKMKNCSECKKDFLCESCAKMANQRQEFSANPNEMKRQPLHEFGHTLPKYIAT